MQIYKSIKQLVNYALNCGLIEKTDEIFALNELLACLGLDSYEDPGVVCDAELEDILKEILDYACEKGMIENSVTYRDLFDTKIMSIFVQRPSDVISKFNSLYQTDKAAASDYFYKLCCDCDYIRRYRIKKDMKWTTETKYGVLDVTINLSKPEKDPKAIAAAAKSANVSYPKCNLCHENVGYAGRVNHPARQNLRQIPLSIAGEEWYLQYSPYVYYNEHCIVLSGEHKPMAITPQTFKNLFDFIDFLPHYFVGSNADLPIVGGSILSHEHYQGGKYEFAMERAQVDTPLVFDGFEEVSAGVVNWPMTVIRLDCADRKKVEELASRILAAWREYTDEESFIYAYTDDVPHNTITPIARKRGECYELDLVLRNNITTEDYPDGFYHPHPEYHCVKKENIGLIEVMGLAVLPARLKNELEIIKSAMLSGADLSENEITAKHSSWINEILSSNTVDESNAEALIKNKIGIIYCSILEQCGVFSHDEDGLKGLLKFVARVNQRC